MDLYWQTSACLGYRMYFRRWVLVHRYGENTLALNTKEQHFQAIDLCLLNDPILSAYMDTEAN
jgi:hypothetical protein